MLFFMDRMQIKLKLALDVLGIPVTIDRYRQICQVVYVAKTFGVHIGPSRVEVDERGMAYSPMSHEGSGSPSHNLLDDLEQMQAEIRCGRDDSYRYKLDRADKVGLRRVKLALEETKEE